MPPILTTTEPSACFASLPVSISITLPSDNSIVFFTIFISFFSTCLPLWEWINILFHQGCPPMGHPFRSSYLTRLYVCHSSGAAGCCLRPQTSLRKKGGVPSCGHSPFVGSYYDVAYRRRPSSLTIALYLSISISLR